MMEALGSGQGFMRSARLDGATAQEDAARAHVATRPNGHRLAGNIPLEEELMVNTTKWQKTIYQRVRMLSRTLGSTTEHQPVVSSHARVGYSADFANFDGLGR